MLPRNRPERIQIAFDDHRLVANAGLLLPATLARRLGLPQLADRYLDLGGAPGRANTGDKLMTLVASALAGGDCIDDADVLRAGGTASVLGCVVKAPSTLGTFLRSFRWGHVRQLDRVSRELLARAWAAGTGPGDGPLTIDIDSTICETYGLSKEGARHHGYTGQRGYHPLLAVAAGTGEVLMARLREGRANTARGAAHFLRETLGRVRYAGAKGQLTVRADSGFYTHAVVQTCRKMKVRFSITVRLRQNLRDLIEAIPEADWSPIPYWMARRRRRGRNHLHPLHQSARRRAGAAHRPAGSAHPRLPVGAIRHLQLSRLHHRPSGGYPGTGGRPPPPRRDREHHPGPQVRRGAQSSPLGALPGQRSLAGGTGHGPQPGPLDRAHRSGRDGGDHQDPPAPPLFPGRTHHPQGPPPHTASAQALALGNPVPLRLGAVAGHATPLLTPLAATNSPTNQIEGPHQLAPTRSARVLC